MYLSMIDEHIISIESKGSAFNDATFFYTNACSCNGDVLMNSNVLDAWYNGINNTIDGASCANIITNFMGHNLAIIFVQILLFISVYEINTNVIHLLVLFEYQCHMHCLDMNVICLFVLFKHGCYMSICVIYT
jgi:hypothetical protein